MLPSFLLYRQTQLVYLSLASMRSLYLASWEAEMEIIQLSRSSTLWLPLTSASIKGNLGPRLFSYGPTCWSELHYTGRASKVKKFPQISP